MSKLLYGVSKKPFRYNGRSVEFGTPFEAADSHVRVLVAMTRASEHNPIPAMTSTTAIVPPAPKPTPTQPPAPPVDAKANEGESTGSTGNDAGEGESAGTGDGNEATPPSESDTIVSLRERYKTKFGSSPDGRWSKARIVEELTKD